MGKNVHVVHRKDSDSWEVKYENDATPLSMFDTKEEAVQNGREMAMAQHAELIIHNKDGVISQKLSYGHDPRNVKG